MAENKLRVAVVGCGNIAGPYAKTMQPFEQIELMGATDVDPQRAQDFVANYGGTAYPSLEALLADERSTPWSISRSTMPIQP